MSMLFCSNLALIFGKLMFLFLQNSYFTHFCGVKFLKFIDIFH